MTRTVKTALGATAVQIVHSNRGGSRQIEHIGSAHPKDLETMARRYHTITIHAGQQSITAADPLPVDLDEALNAIPGGC